MNFPKCLINLQQHGKILSPLSTETLWRIEENSTEPKYSKIYLFHFSSFQNENTTISGTNFIQQDAFLFENNPDFSMRFRYSQMKSLNQYNGGVERDFNRERSLRINFRMIEEMSNQTDIVNETDNVNAPITSNRQRLITNNNITTDFSYGLREILKWDLELKRAEVKMIIQKIRP